MYKTISCALLQLVTFSLTVMFLSLLLHVPADHSFLMLSSVLSEFKSWLIHSSVDRHLGSFFVWDTVINGIALNIFVPVRVHFPFS